jgi:hypothetical protein
VPVLDNERQNERDEEKIEEIEHVADRRRREDLPLISSAAPNVRAWRFLLRPRLIAPPLTRRQVLERHSPDSVAEGAPLSGL